MHELGDGHGRSADLGADEFAVEIEEDLLGFGPGRHFVARLFRCQTGKTLLKVNRGSAQESPRALDDRAAEIEFHVDVFGGQLQDIGTAIDEAGLIRV